MLLTFGKDHLETDNFAEGDEAYMPLDAFQKRVRARVATMPFYFFEILARRELIRGLPHPDRLSAIIEELERFLEGMLTMKKAYALLFRIWQGDTLTRTEGSILNIVFKTADIAKMYSSLPPIAYTLEIMVVFELSIKRPPEDVDIVALVLFAIDIRSKDLYNDAFVVFVNKLFMMFGFDTDLGHHRLPNKVKHKAIMELARISNIRREVVISEVFTLEDFDGRKIWPSGTSGSLSLDNPTSEYRYRVLRDIENTISGIRRTFYIDIYDQLGNNLRVPCSELNDGDYPWE